MEAFVEVDGVLSGDNFFLPTGAGLLNHFHLSPILNKYMKRFHHKS